MKVKLQLKKKNWTQKIRQICINAKFVIMYVEHRIIYGITLDQFMRESNVQFVTKILRQNNLWRSISQPGILDLIVEILRWIQNMKLTKSLTNVPIVKMFLWKNLNWLNIFKNSVKRKRNSIAIFVKKVVKAKKN